MKTLVLATLAIASTAIECNATEIVVKDHVTDSSNWNELPLIAHVYPIGVPDGAVGATATFVGNGRTLKAVSGVFAHNSVTGVPNQGNPMALDFRFGFHETLNNYVADPFYDSPTGNSVSHVFGTVSNQNDWLTPIGTADDGHQLFRWEVDVESLAISTIPGQLHFVTLLPEANSISGGTLLSMSNGVNAVSHTDDWAASPQAGPDTLTGLGAPHPFAAFRVTTIPEPGGLLMVIVLFALTHIEIRQGIRAADIRST